RCEGGVEFCVADTGVGIPPDALPIIFEPFRQIESASTRRYGGVGLRLHIVRPPLHMLRGPIHLESGRGRRSGFRVWRAARQSPTLKQATGAPEPVFHG